MADGGRFPPLGGDGWMIIGDSAGFLNSARLKGIHLAIKSGNAGGRGLHSKRW